MHRTFPTVGGRSRVCIGTRARAEGEVRAGFAKKLGEQKQKLSGKKVLRKFAPISKKT